MKPDQVRKVARLMAARRLEWSVEANDTVDMLLSIAGPSAGLLTDADMRALEDEIREIVKQLRADAGVRER